MMRVKEVDPSLRRVAPGRDRAVDLVKTAAIFGVLLIHVSAGGLGRRPGRGLPACSGAVCPGRRCRCS